MGSGRFVGRVGALAVALGVGSALAVPVAWADPESASLSAAGQGGTASDHGAAGGDTTSSTSADARDASAGAHNSGELYTPSVEAAESGDDDADSDASAAVDAPLDSDSERTPNDGSEPTAGESGDDLTIGSDTDTDDAGGEAVGSIDDSGENEVATPPQASAVEPAAPATDLEAVGGEHGRAPAELRSRAVVESNPSSLENRGETTTLTGKQISAGDARSDGPEAASTFAAPAAQSAGPAEAAGLTSSSPAVESGSWATSVISALLISGVPGAPAAPVESPLLWGLLAFARRQFGQRPLTVEPRPSPVSDGRLLEPHTDAATANTNSGPVPGTVTVGAPSASSGSVKGRVSATDPDGNRLRFSGSVTTAKGRVRVSFSGSFTYTPASAARHAAAALGATTVDGIDTFTVTVTDTAGATATIPVTVSIAGRNSAPRRVKATAGTPDITSGAVAVTATATDSDRDTLTYTSAATTAKGSLVNNGGGKFVYTPTLAARNAAAVPGAPTSAKTDTVTVTVTDGHGGTTTTTIKVKIAPLAVVPNRNPSGGSYTAGQPNPATGTVTGTATATDPDNDTLTYAGPTTTAKDGMVTVNANGTFIYTPTADARHSAATGTTANDTTDTFTITVIDGRGGSLAIPITVAIAPATTNATFSAIVDQVDNNSGAITGHIGVNGSAGGAYTFALAKAPSPTFGRVVVDSATGVFTFTPTTQALVAAYKQQSPLVADFVVSANNGFVVSSVAVSMPIGVSSASLKAILSRLGSQPAGVATAPDGMLYVIDSGANSLSVLPAGSNSISSTVRVGAAPTDVKVAPDGRVWVVNGSDDSVTVLNHDGTAAVATIPVGLSPVGLAFGANGTVFVANAGDGTITVIKDVAVSSTLNIGGVPVGITTGPDGRVYVTDFGNSVVRIVDPALDNNVGSIDEFGENPFGVAVAPDGQIFLTRPLDDTVTVLTRGSDGYSSRNLIIDHSPRAITMGTDGFVYVIGASGVTIINPTDLSTRLIATEKVRIALPRGPMVASTSQRMAPAVWLSSILQRQLRPRSRLGSTPPL